MAKLKQTFHNTGDAPLFLNLELSTSRFRLNPGEELILLYDPADRAVDEHGAALRIELVPGADGPELVIYTRTGDVFPGRPGSSQELRSRLTAAIAPFADIMTR